MDRQDTIRSILDSLRKLVRELRISSQRTETRSGLTVAQLFVLGKVAVNQPLSINALAALTLTHQSSVSVVAQRLVERGFLVQRQAIQDRRRKELTITAKGRTALKQAPASVQDQLIAAISTMNTSDQQTLARLLEMLTHMIGLEDSRPILFFEKELHSQKINIRHKPVANLARNRKIP